MSERAAMIRKWKSGLYTVTDLAREFGVSRPTVYEWISRDGEDLADRRSTPKTCPHRTDEEIGRRIIEAKRRYDDWGPRKLIQVLEREDPDTQWPSPSTAARILDAEGLVQRLGNVVRPRMSVTLARRWARNVLAR